MASFEKNEKDYKGAPSETETSLAKMVAMTTNEVKPLERKAKLVIYLFVAALVVITIVGLVAALLASHGA